MRHPPLTVQSANEDYTRFKLEQEGFGIVATVESQSDFPEFSFLLASAPELLLACEDAIHDIRYVISQPWSKRSEGDTVVLKSRLNCLISAVAKATGSKVLS